MTKYKILIQKKWQIGGWKLKIVDYKTVKLTVGIGIDPKKIIKEKNDWIIKNLAKVEKKETLKNLKKIVILDEIYKVFLSLGKIDSLNFFEEKKEIHIRIKKMENRYLKKILDQKMRPKALKLIRQSTKELAEKYNIKFGEIKIKNQKTRFGSCSSRGNLNFNWQIIFFPKEQFEHVLLHELCHILIKDHSRSFWQKLEEMDKNCKQNNQWLKKEGVKQFLI